MSHTAKAASSTRVFDDGKYTVLLLQVDQNNSSSSSSLPPKPLLIASPSEEGEFPILIFLHGYLLFNSFYSQLLQHIASHGFIAVAPQLYQVVGPDAREEVKSTAAITDWLIEGLSHVLPKHIRPNLRKLGIVGHSRGGKVAFALALGQAKTKIKFSALMGIDPVDGMGKGKQTPPPVLTYIPHSFDLNMAVLVVGTGLGELKKNPLFPPCAPNGVNHKDFFYECSSPAWHFVAKDCGHMDILDDDTKGLRGKSTYCLCKNGKAREPMRRFTGGVIIAFTRAYLEGDNKDLKVLREEPVTSPVELTIDIF